MANSNEYMREYMLKRYHTRRTKALEKLGSRCTHCGSEQELQFHHKNPEGKSFTIAKMWSINEIDFWKEIDKCELLCKACHTNQHANKEHGTLTSHKYCNCELCKKAKADYMREYMKSYIR